MHINTLKTLFLALFVFAFSAPAQAQAEIEQSVQLLTSDLIGAVTLDVDDFGKWIGKANAAIKEGLTEVSEPMEVVAIATLSRTGPIALQLAADPPQKAGQRKDLMKKLESIPAPVIKHAPYSIALVSVVNGGLEEDASFSPPFADPTELRIQSFVSLDLQAKDKRIKEWAREELAPIFAYYTSNVEDGFKGVLSMGKLLTEKKFLKQSTDQLTSQNPDYWRAVMEMSLGNQLIPYCKITMHLIKGEYDQAERMLFFMSFFSDKETLGAQIHDELNAMTKQMKAHINQEIQKGIALHDQGKYKAAVKHYDLLLKTFPNSAWLQYERYFSDDANGGKTQSGWDKAKPIIYAADPLYPMDVRASTGREAYLLFRRQEISSLFKSKDDLQKDLVTYADIALDLGAYGYGAQLYWLISRYLDEEAYGERDMLAHYFYCLDKLGNKETLQFIEDSESYAQKFAQIDQERRELMEASMFYKSFDKSE